MKKLNMGYAKYFNEKYERKGTLFEGRYKSVAVKHEAHFIHLPYYIHLNPLDLIFPEWRKRELRDRKKAMKFLESYRWSSHLDYLGKHNFPSVTKREFLMKFFGGTREYGNSIEQWMKDATVEEVGSMTLE
jgi:putative transposase